MTAEDDRAAEFRRKMRARVRNKRAAERALSGDAASLTALKAKTEPLKVYDSNGVRRGDVR